MLLSFRAHSALYAHVCTFACVVFTFRNQYWLWCPVIAPIVGALGAFHVPKLVCPLVRLIIPFAVGVFLYDSLLFTGSESLLNKP